MSRVAQSGPSESFHAQLLDVMEAMPDALALLDTGGRIVLLNARAESLFGCTRGQLLGRALESLVPSRHHGTLDTHRRMLDLKPGSCGAPVRVELHGGRNDGSEFPLEMTLCSLDTRQGHCVLATLRDVSDRHRVEDSLNEKNAELEAANQELAAFDYSIAHDLRAPLDRLRGFAAILEHEQGSKLEGTARDALLRIAEAGRSMDQLITDMLALATATRGTLARSVVDVTALAQAAAATLRRAEPEREVEIAIEEDMKARADPGLLRIAVQNLLANAWKYTRGRAPGRIDCGCDTTDGEVVFFVRDNGIGFDPANAQDLFKPFQRLHAAGEFEGSGIGLATVERIVQRHGGRIWAQAQAGVGASFFFTLARASR